MSPNLRRAIKLREWCRVACDQEPPDWKRIVELNRRADAAYERLTSEERTGYAEWCWGSGDPAEQQRKALEMWKEIFAAVPKEEA